MIKIQLPAETPEEQKPSLLGQIGKAAEPILSPIRDVLETPWLGTQGVIPQAAASALREATAGWIKPAVEEPETYEERVAATVGSMLGFGIPLGVMEKTKIAKGLAFKGSKVLQHLQLDHAIPAAIYGFVKDTGLPFGSDEDMVARKANAISTGLTIGGLSMATKFVQARVATRLMDAALPKLAENPALRSMVTSFMTDMGIGAGMGAMQPERGLGRGESALISGLGFGLGGAIGRVGGYKALKIEAEDFKNNLVKSGAKLADATKIVNQYYDGKMKFEDLQSYNKALKAARTPEEASKVASDVAARSETQYGERVGQKETPASAEARAKAASEEAAKRQLLQGGDNKQTEGKVALASEAAGKAEADFIAKARSQIEADLNKAYPTKMGKFSEQNPKIVEEVLKQHLEEMDRVKQSGGDRNQVSDQSLNDKLARIHASLSDPATQGILLKSHMDNEVNTVYPDVNWETTDNDVLPLNQALDAKAKGNNASLDILVKGKEKQKELNRKQKKVIAQATKDLQKQTGAPKGKWVKTEAGIRWVPEGKGKVEPKPVQKAAEKPAPSKQEKTQAAVAKTEKKIEESQVKEREKHIKEVEKGFYEKKQGKGEKKPAEKLKERRTYESNLAELQKSGAIKRDVTEIDTGNKLYINKPETGYEVRRPGGAAGTPGFTDVERAIKNHREGGIGISVILNGDKVIEQGHILAFTGAEPPVRGDITVRGNMNMPLEEPAQYYIRSEGKESAPLNAMEGIIATEGRYDPLEFEFFVNKIADHNRRFPDDPWTITVLKDNARIKVNYDKDMMDIRDVFIKNLEESIPKRFGTEYAHKGEEAMKKNDQMLLAIGRMARTPYLYVGREPSGVTGTKPKDIITLRDAINEAMNEVGYTAKKPLEWQHKKWLAEVRKELDRTDIDLDTNLHNLTASYKKIFSVGVSGEPGKSLDTSEGVPGAEVPDLSNALKVVEEIVAANKKAAAKGEFSVGTWGKEIKRLEKELDKLKLPNMPKVTLEFMRGIRDTAAKEINYVQQGISDIRKWLEPVKTKEGRKTYLTTLHEEPGYINVKDEEGKVIGKYYKRKPPFRSAEYDLRATGGLEPSERDLNGELKSLYKRKKDLQANLGTINKVLEHVESYDKWQKRTPEEIDAEVNYYFNRFTNPIETNTSDSRPFEDEEAVKGQAYGPTYYGGLTAQQLKGRLFKTLKDVTFTDVDGRQVTIPAEEKVLIDKVKQTKSEGVEETEYHVNHGINKWVTREGLADIIDISDQAEFLGMNREYLLKQDWQSASLFPSIRDKFKEMLKLSSQEDINSRASDTPDAPNFAVKRARNAKTAMQQLTREQAKELRDLFDKTTEGMGILDKMDVQDDILKAMHEFSVEDPNDLLNITRSEYGRKELEKGTSAWERLSPEQQRFTAQLKATYKAMAQVLMEHNLLSPDALEQEKIEGYAPIVHLQPDGTVRGLGSLWARGSTSGPLKRAQHSYEENVQIAKDAKSRLLADPSLLYEITMTKYAKDLAIDHTSRTLEMFKDMYGRPAMAFHKDIPEADMKYYMQLDSGNTDVRGLGDMYKRWIGTAKQAPYVLRDLDKDGEPVARSATGRWLQSLEGQRGGDLLLHPSLSTWARVKGLVKQSVLTNPAYIGWQAYNSFVPILGPFGAATSMFQHAGYKNYRNFDEMKLASERAGLRVGDEILRAIYDDFVRSNESGDGKVRGYLDTIEKTLNNKYKLRDWIFKRMESAAVQAWELQRARFARDYKMEPRRAAEVAADAVNLAMGTPDPTTFDGYTNFVSNIVFLARNNQVAAMRMLLGMGLGKGEYRGLSTKYGQQMLGFHGYTPEERQALGGFFRTQMLWQTITWATTSALLSFALSGKGTGKNDELGFLEGISPWHRHEDINKALMIHTGIKRTDGSEVLVEAPVFKDARDMLQLFTGPVDYGRNKMDPTLKFALEMVVQGQILPGEKAVKPFSEPDTPLLEHVKNVALKKFFGFAGWTKPIVGLAGGQNFVNKYGNIYPMTTTQELSNLAGFRQGAGIGGPGIKGAAVRAGLEAQQKEATQKAILRNAMLDAYITGDEKSFNKITAQLYPDIRERMRQVSAFKLKMSNPAEYQLKKWKNYGPAEQAYYGVLGGYENPLAL